MSIFKKVKKQFIKDNITHVTNDYCEDIYVKVAGDRKYVELQGFKFSGKGASASMDAKYTWQLAEKDGYTPIHPKGHLGFNPKTEDKVYVTIFSKSGNNICHCFEIDEDESVFVNKEGYLKRAEYGCLLVEKK